ncbi:hypothetical protein [Streptomyces violarus]|nr:hypothetical protein [Streptomyces violarus]MCT9138166.1 hypothetical protein [Streptomyces violarus]
MTHTEIEITPELIRELLVHGRPGGKPTCGPPAQAALRRLLDTADPS